MKQHKVPESNLAGRAHQEPSTGRTSRSAGVSAALADLAAECRLLLEQDAGSADGLLEEVRAALAAAANINHVTGLLSGAIGHPASAVAPRRIDQSGNDLDPPRGCPPVPPGASRRE
ncbi:MAG: hypothetical protein PVG09_06015 [Thiohalocapsa sp.]|jgi:hypothetical protein